MVCYFINQIATIEAFFKEVSEDLINYTSLILSFLLVQLCMVEENVNTLYLETPTR